ncbi:MAG: PEP-CTERM sorting domain-containing protein [Proteobacteria bacterium]|nr:PEP-CTERM sorting domain-containing protein [Pseudomonadota bacterium]
MTFRALALSFGVLAAGLAAAPASAALVIADFGGGVLFPTGVGNIFYGMNRNAAPYNVVTGSIVYDTAAVPGAGTGFVNVSIPVPNANAFAFAAGTQLSIDQADLETGATAAIQFKNGVFNGVVFTSDFSDGGNNYQLNIQGGTWMIYDAQTFQTKASGYIDIGANGLTNIRPYVTGVPEPESWALMIAGFALAGLGVRKRRLSAHFA